MSDLASPYLSARLWFAGANPYDRALALGSWYSGGAPHLAQSQLAAVASSVYPPPTLLLMVPLALLRWQEAFDAFFVIGLLLYAATVYGLVRLGWPHHHSLSGVVNDPAAMFFVAFSLGFAPIHTAFHSVNIVLFASCAAILSILVPGALHTGPSRSTAPQADLPNSKLRLPAGLLVGIGAASAICIKPTTGIFLLPWLIRERRWRWTAGILLACTAISAFSIAPLIARQGLAWLPDYRHSVEALFTHGGNADVSPENWENTDRIDLQLVGFAAFGNRTLAAAVAAAVYLGLLLAFLLRAGWRFDGVSRGASAENLPGPREMPLLVASGCLALGLLPSYSRMYAAIVLLPLVLWCFQHLRFSSARWLLVLLSDFLLNTSAIVRYLGYRADVIFYNHRLWDLTIGGHTCWLLLAIGCLLVYAAGQQSREDAARLAGPRTDSMPTDTLPVALAGRRS